MSRTVRRVNKYVSYCTLYNVNRCNSELKIALMNSEENKYCMRYLGYDEKYAAKFYRDGYYDRFCFSKSFRRNSVYKDKEKAYYKQALVKCLKSDDLEYEAINIRKKLAGLSDWW